MSPVDVVHDGFEPFLVPLEGTAEKLRSIIEPALAPAGLELVQLHFVRGSHRDILRLFVDRHDGRVSIAELERANRLLSDLLDVEDAHERLFPHAWDLEVGSPGLDRPLTKKSHFSKAIGQRVKVKTKSPHDGARSFKGVLLDAGPDGFRVERGEGGEQDAVAIGYDDVVTANVVFDLPGPQPKKSTKGAKKPAGAADPAGVAPNGGRRP